MASTPDARLVAFEIDALLSAANVDRNFQDDTGALADARRLTAFRLGVPAPAGARAARLRDGGCSPARPSLYSP